MKPNTIPDVSRIPEEATQDVDNFSLNVFFF